MQIAKSNNLKAEIYETDLKKLCKDALDMGTTFISFKNAHPELVEDLDVMLEAVTKLATTTAIICFKHAMLEKVEEDVNA